MTNNTYIKSFVFAAACLGMLLFGIVMISLGSILPDINNKFQLSEAEIGYLATLLPFGILVGSLLFGPSVDWFSYKKILIAGAIFTALGLLGMAVAEVLFLLNISVFCIGLGGGILNGVTNALVSEISEGDPSADLSLLGVFFGVGALGTPVVLGLFKGIFSYENILMALIALIVLILAYFLALKFPVSKETKGVSIQEALKMLGDPFLLLLGFILFFVSGLEGLTNNWTTTYLGDIKNIAAPNALFALSAFVGALTLARLILGKLLRIYQPLTIMIVGTLLALVGYLLLSRNNGYYQLVLAMVAAGFGLAAAFPVILGFAGQRYLKNTGTAFSIVITIALIGNVLANYAIGLFGEQKGLSILPYFLIGGVLAVLILLFILKTQNKK